MDIIERLRFDAARCEMFFSKGVASNIEEGAAEIERLRAALKPFAEVGQWLFSRPEVPDDLPVVELPGLNSYQVILTRGHFKEAHRLAHEQSAGKADV